MPKKKSTFFSEKDVTIFFESDVEHSWIQPIVPDQLYDNTSKTFVKDYTALKITLLALCEGRLEKYDASVATDVTDVVRNNKRTLVRVSFEEEMENRPLLLRAAP